MKRLSAAIAALVFSYLLPPAACAVDGVKLIGQPRPGTFPFTISASGSYRLKSNITIPDENTTAILVTADNVTLDLNGFSIVGPTVCTGIPVTSCTPTGTGRGIDASGVKNTQVKNGSILGAGSTGIILEQGAIDHVTVTNNGGNGIEDASLVYGTQVLVTNCTANSNGAGGIYNAWSVIDSSANLNQNDGIHLPTTVSNCSASNNGGNGIAGYGNVTTVANSTAQFNGVTGISGYLVTNSAANQNGYKGIVAFGATGCVTSGNITANIEAFGIVGHNLCSNAPCP